MDGAAADPSFAILHGLYWLTANLAESGPILLAIDDLHWADRPSLRFLEYLSGRLEGLAILLVATYRPASPVPRPSRSPRSAPAGRWIASSRPR